MASLPDPIDKLPGKPTPGDKLVQAALNTLIACAREDRATIATLAARVAALEAPPVPPPAPPPAPPLALALAPRPLVLAPMSSASVTLTATRAGAPAAGRPVAVASANPAKATVAPASGVTDADGKFTATVTAVAATTSAVAVTFTVDGVTADCLVSVADLAGGGTAGAVKVVPLVDLPRQSDGTPLAYNAATDAIEGSVVDTTAPTVLSTRIVVAGATPEENGAAFQAALNAAVPGDKIQLQAGVVYRGSFYLPVKGAGGWVTITTDGVLPAAGTQATMADLAQMPKIEANAGGAQGAFWMDGAAHHYRFEGIAITHAAGLAGTTALVTIDNPAASTTAQLPHHFVFDRCLIYGASGFDCRRGLYANGTDLAFVDGGIYEMHASGGDSQAVCGNNGTKRLLLRNAHLEGASENLMLGGGDAKAAALVPQDIEVRRCRFYKPLAWRGVWPVKNLLELKTGIRVLVEDCLFENNWLAAQTGWAVVLWSVDQSAGPYPWSETSNVLIRHCRITNSRNGFQLSAYASGVEVPMHRVQIENVSVEQLGGPDAATGTPVQHDRRIDDLTLRRVTFTRCATGGPVGVYAYVQAPHAPGNPNTAMAVADGGVVDPIQRSARFRFLDNIVDTVDGIFRTDVSNNSQVNLTTMNDAAPDGPQVAGNVWAKTGSQATLPAGNVQPASVAAIGFVDYAGGNFRLAGGSPAKGQATDGGDPGADYDTLAARLAGVA